MNREYEALKIICDDLLYKSEYDFMDSFETSRSLNNIYDSISLYDYEDNEENKKLSKKISWEDWYLRKKILSLKQKKTNSELDHGEKKPNQSISEAEKKQKLMEWLFKKKNQIKSQKLEREKKVCEKEKRHEIELVKKKQAEEKYAEWLEKIKKKEIKEKESIKKQLEDANKHKQLDKIKRLEQNKDVNEKKNLIVPRSKGEKIAYAFVNGKLHSYYDWSTSPAPSFVNKNDFVF